MTVKIIIKRIVPRDRELELLPLVKELRTQTIRRNGYISGETLRRIDKPDETVVISTWESAEDWNQWANSPERAAIQQKIDILLGKKTTYEIYSHT